MSIPFIKIHNQLTAVGSPFTSANTSANTRATASDAIRIISILGKARMGKSTFLNAIVSHIQQKSETPFATQDDDEHCTRGVDAYYIPDASLLLLDFQGLSLEDSRHDPALLLLAYRISDIMILNERMMLQNEALKLMEPICAFMQYIDEDIPKPKLYFRISDGDIVGNPAKNLEKVMATYNDQYQSIRDSIRTLFQPDIGIFKTDTMDRSVKNEIQRGDYTNLLEPKQFGFYEAIVKLLEIPATRTVQEWSDLVPHVIRSINENHKINIEKLDVVGQTARIELLEWIQNVSPHVFQPIDVDGMQDTYEHVVARMKEKMAILQDFETKFRSVAEEIKRPYSEQLDAKLQLTIDKAIHVTSKKAAELCKDVATVAQEDYNFPLLVSHAFHDSPDSWFIFLTRIHLLKNIASVVYRPVGDPLMQWVSEREEEIRQMKEDLFTAEWKELDEVQRAAKAATDAFVEATKADLDADYDSSHLTKSATTILEYYTKRTYTHFLQKAADIIQCRNLTVSMKNGKFQYMVTTLPFSTTMVHTYAKLSSILHEFQQTLDAFIVPNINMKEHKEGVLHAWLIQKKLQSLKGKALEQGHMYRMEDYKRGQLQFVEDSILFGKPYYMTAETHNNLMAMYERCRQRLIQKGYMTDVQLVRVHDDRKLKYLTCTITMKDTLYDTCIRETFLKYVKKEYMLMCMQGKQITTFTFES